MPILLCKIGFKIVYNLSTILCISNFLRLIKFCKIFFYLLHYFSLDLRIFTNLNSKFGQEMNDNIYNLLLITTLIIVNSSHTVIINIDSKLSTYLLDMQPIHNSYANFDSLDNVLVLSMYLL